MAGSLAVIIQHTIGEFFCSTTSDPEKKDLFRRCIIKLGTAGKITGFDIDTSHFNGNEAPEADVQVLFDDSTTSDPTSSDPRVSPTGRHKLYVSLNFLV